MTFKTIPSNRNPSPEEHGQIAQLLEGVIPFQPIWIHKSGFDTLLADLPAAFVLRKLSGILVSFVLELQGKFSKP
jgi:hypothetical protein